MVVTVGGVTAPGVPVGAVLPGVVVVLGAVWYGSVVG